MTKNSLYSAVALATTIAAGALTLPVAQADTTGNIGVFSKYVLRGITTPASETNGPAIQGGFDYTHSSGFYAGYWGSNLDYSYSNSGQAEPASGFENDLYAGYAGTAGPVSYSAGLIQYVYMSVDDSNGLEFAGTAGYGPVTAGVKYLLKDVIWGNKGDAYWTLAYATKLPMDFSLGATAGWYTYKDSGKFITSTVEDSAFRHLDVSLTHPIAKTGADMSATFTFGGKDRGGNQQKDALVLGVKYGFNL